MKFLSKFPQVDRRPLVGATIFAWIAVAPWIWGFADAHPAVANHVALVLGFGPLAILIANLRAAAIVTMLSGLWLALSPWVLGYAGDHLAWLNELASGGALIVLCASAAGIRRFRHRVPALRASPHPGNAARNRHPVPRNHGVYDPTARS